MKRKKTSLSLATLNIGVTPCLFELNGQAPHQIKLIPAGQFKAKDGRPHGLAGWIMSDAIAEAVIAAANTLQDKILVDYEHQTLYSRENGQPSPAAAWFKNLEWRSGDGLYATDVEWTEAAKAAIASKEYRYISPVLSYNKKSGEITGILMAALVNYPAIDGLEDLAATHFNFVSDKHILPEKKMNEALKDLLGLSDDADDQAINTAVATLKAKLDQVSNLETQISTLKASTEPDPSKFVPVETMIALQQQVASLRNQINNKECGDLIEVALADGRLLEAQLKWAESLDTVALKAYLLTAQPIAGLQTLQTGGEQLDDKGDPVLSEQQLAVCSQMGVPVDDYKQTLKGAA